MSDNGRTDAHRYDDMLELARHESKTHPHMSAHDRAAQFSPFAALTGYGAAIDETARLTEGMTELAEDSMALVDARLQYIKQHAGPDLRATVTYFEPDARKSGGAYVTVTSGIKKVDDVARTLVLADGTAIPVDRIRAIGGAPFCRAGE